jgi:putative acetyltransferase
MDVVIRKETPEDHPHIQRVIDLAFGQPNEGAMVGQLRSNPRFIPALSLVALDGDTVAGHILFFPIDIVTADDRETSLSLAPLAVHPDHQGKGIGGKLVAEGLKVAERLGFDSVVVTGHPAYYPRFGFRPAIEWGIRSPVEAPDEAFMALELIDEGLNGKSGVVEYPREYGVAL